MKNLMRSRVLMAVMAGVVGFVVETEPVKWMDGNLTSQAEARVGRPATPGSVAGVARRTTRRTIRRTGAYISVLPANCGAVIVDNVSLYYCGGVYYQPYQGQYVIVVLD